MTFPPLYKALSGINPSLPTTVNGSIMGVSAYAIASAVEGNDIKLGEIVGIVGGVSAAHLLAGFAYWPIRNSMPMLAPYLGSIYTSVGAVGGLAIAQLF